jgi:hypothetical protein
MPNCDDVRRELESKGLLLLQDKRMASVAAIIAGETISGSWWSHARGREIWACSESLEKDALVTRLIDGKVTYVHPRLWPAFYGVATSGAPWQTAGLSAAARALLKKVPCMAKGPVARELQQRLLVHAEEVHTTSGRHETRLSSWPTFAAALPPDLARGELEKAAIAIGAKVEMLPWRQR